jgi:hypothetical protein
MDLELIYHPKYGTIAEYELWTETISDELEAREGPTEVGKGDARGNPLAAPERMGKVYVQLMLPHRLG